MLEPRSVAIVGASAQAGTFGARMLAEAGKSTAKPVVYPVNRRYRRDAAVRSRLHGVHGAG